jgi:iron complex outermembrane receptor protein
VDLCAGYRKDFEVEAFRNSHDSDFGATLRWQPTASTTIVPFWSYNIGGAQRIVPGVYTDGTVRLALFRTQDLGVQDWTTWGWRQTNVGVIAKSALLDHWEIAAGLFHSLERDPMGYQPYLTLLTPQTADSTMDVAPPLTAASTSGELRLTRVFQHPSHQQRLEFSIRGRSVDRSFGGDDIIDYHPPITIDDRTPLPPPAWMLAPQSHDSTRQFDLGVTLEERWPEVGSFAVGVLHDQYRREVLLPPATVDSNRTKPWLLNLRTEADAGRGRLIYASFVQGLEDSALAPVSADNRNEPPPATRTWQVDGGIRWVPSEKLQFVLGAFKIHKPYFNLDAENIYRQLGRVEHTGVEASLAYSDSGLTLLLGGVRLRPNVQRDIVEPGATGSVPLGPVPLTLTVNLDYAPPGWGPLAASLQWTRLSPRVDTTDNSSYLPSLATLGAGLRCRWTMLERPWTARLDGYNLTNARGIHVSSLEVVLPEQSRRFGITIATDL